MGLRQSSVQVWGRFGIDRNFGRRRLCTTGVPTNDPFLQWAVAPLTHPPPQPPPPPSACARVPAPAASRLPCRPLCCHCSSHWSSWPPTPTPCVRPPLSHGFACPSPWPSALLRAAARCSPLRPQRLARGSARTWPPSTGGTPVASRRHGALDGMGHWGMGSHRSPLSPTAVSAVSVRLSVCCSDRRGPSALLCSALPVHVQSTTASSRRRCGPTRTTQCAP